MKRTYLKRHPLPATISTIRNTAVFSDDRGQTWKRSATVSDDPFHGDSEVGIVELEPGHLLAVTRVGFGNGIYGQPSRLIHSFDNGRSWQGAPTGSFLWPAHGSA